METIVGLIVIINGLGFLATATKLAVQGAAGIGCSRCRGTTEARENDEGLACVVAGLAIIVSTCGIYAGAVVAGFVG